MIKLTQTFNAGDVGIVTDSFLDSVLLDESNSWRELFDGMNQDDVSENGVEMAQEFADEHGVKIRFLEVFVGTDEFAYAVKFEQTVTGTNYFTER